MANSEVDVQDVDPPMCGVDLCTPEMESVVLHLQNSMLSNRSLHCKPMLKPKFDLIVSSFPN